jgi:hypothetical protein
VSERRKLLEQERRKLLEQVSEAWYRFSATASGPFVPGAFAKGDGPSDYNLHHLTVHLDGPRPEDFAAVGADLPEVKRAPVRRVRTPEGARRYRLPIGSPIVPGSELPDVRRINPLEARPPDDPTESGDVSSTFVLGMDSVPEDYAEKVRGRLRDVLAIESVEQMADNLEEVWAQIPAEDVERFRKWYQEAHADVRESARRHGVRPRTSAGVYAALSPQNLWPANKTAADHLMRVLRDDPVFDPSEEALAERRRLSPRAKLAVGKRLSEMTDEEVAWAVVTMAIDHPVRDENGRIVAWTCGTANIAKAVAIWRGADPDEVLSGHKVRSFFNCLLIPDNPLDVVVDTHAISAAALEPMAASSRRLKSLVDVPSTAKGGRRFRGVYPAVADAYRILGRRHGVAPMEAQAIVWSWWTANGRKIYGHRVRPEGRAGKR